MEVAPPDAVVDLLGALAYGQLSAFDRLAADSLLAPELRGRTTMAAVAAGEFEGYRRLADRLRELGAEPEVAMAPFTAALDTFHSLTEPSTWTEAVIKAYVGDGMAADFYREVAAFVDDETATLIRDVLTEGGRAEFAVREVSAAVAARPAEAGSLALWARRLVGEAISQTQHVLADRESLMLLLVEGTGGIGGVSELIGRITDRHAERMVALGLDG